MSEKERLAEVLRGKAKPYPELESIHVRTDVIPSMALTAASR